MSERVGQVANSLLLFQLAEEPLRFLVYDLGPPHAQRALHYLLNQAGLTS